MRASYSEQSKMRPGISRGALRAAGILLLLEALLVALILWRLQG